MLRNYKGGIYPEVPSFNPWSCCPSARNSYRADQFEKLDPKPEWRVLSHFAGSVERALPCARCLRALGSLRMKQGTNISEEEQTFCLKFRTKKGICLLRARGCKQYKNQKLI